MTTLASPTLGGAQHSMWRVETSPGRAGPEHRFDVEQVWTALDGGATVELDREALAFAAGDTIVMPTHACRRVIADSCAGFSAIVSSPAGANAVLTDGTNKVCPPGSLDQRRWAYARWPSSRADLGDTARAILERPLGKLQTWRSR
jgi:quercetin dioxygenase-like cupin family protein